MAKAIKVRDLSLCEGLLRFPGSLVSDKVFDRLLPLYSDSGFYIVEVLNADAAVEIISRYKENPLHRLKSAVRIVADVSGALTGISMRARSIFDRQPLPVEVRDTFLQTVSEDGVRIVRMSDMLNDTENIAEGITLCRLHNLTVDAAIGYAVEPPPVIYEKKKQSLFSRIFRMEEQEELPQPVFPDSYYTDRAGQLEKSGASIVTLTDSEGLLTSSAVFSLMPRLKHAVRCPVGIHADNTFGNALADTITAIIKGVDIIDTNIWWMAGGASAPALELVALFCDRMDIRLDVNMEAVRNIRLEMKRLIDESGYAKDVELPGDFDELIAEMPRKIIEKIDLACEVAGLNKQEELRGLCHEIEQYFGLGEKKKPEELIEGLPDYSAPFIRSTLAGLNMENLYENAVALIPKVRHDAGEPPLIGNVGKIIEGQAVALAVDRFRNAPDYSNRTDEFHALISGIYGHPTLEITPEFRERITGTTEEVPFSSEKYKAPANPILEEFDGKPLAGNDEERLLLHIFRREAPDYLKFIKIPE